VPLVLRHGAKHAARPLGVVVTGELFLPT
jgi:hypothetical protein